MMDQTNVAQTAWKCVCIAQGQQVGTGELRRLVVKRCIVDAVANGILPTLGELSRLAFSLFITWLAVISDGAGIAACGNYI